MINPNFEQYSIECKQFNPDKSYEDLQKDVVAFDAACLEIDDINDAEKINEEMNKVSRKIFRFSLIMESQAQVLQVLEDEFSMWHARKYSEITKQYAGTKPLTEGQKEVFIKTQYADEYMAYKNKLNFEKFNLNILKRTVAALDGYSFKLQGLQSYRKAAIQRGL